MQRHFDQELAELKSTEAQHLAYEMAVCVCDADGAQNSPESKFLDELRGHQIRLEGGDASSDSYCFA